MRNARLLREAVAVWTKGLWEYGVAGARRALLRDWRQQAVASCARNGVLRLRTSMFRDHGFDRYERALRGLIANR